MVVYVNDLLLYSSSNDDITHLISSLQAASVCIQHEGTLESFLGVDVLCSISPTGLQITLLQLGLAIYVIEAVSLCRSVSPPMRTPAEVSRLPKVTDDVPASSCLSSRRC